MIDRQMESPIPMPLGFVVNKDSKMRSAIAGSMPTPVSLTATSTPPGSMRSEDTISSNLLFWKTGPGLQRIMRLDCRVSRRNFGRIT